MLLWHIHVWILSGIYVHLINCGLSCLTSCCQKCHCVPKMIGLQSHPHVCLNGKYEGADKKINEASENRKRASTGQQHAVLHQWRREAYACSGGCHNIWHVLSRHGWWSPAQMSIFYKEHYHYYDTVWGLFVPFFYSFNFIFIFAIAP